MSDAYTLLEGTNAVINPQFGFNTSGGSNVSNSAMGWANQASFSVRRDTFQMVVFNSPGGWSSPLPRVKDGILTLGGFASHSDALSDPLALITITQPTPFVLSVTPPNGGTACTLTGSCIQVSEDDSFVAQDASGRQQSFKTSGPVTSVGWTS
jgi:hypothetical protein